MPSHQHLDHRTGLETGAQSFIGLGSSRTICVLRTWTSNQLYVTLDESGNNLIVRQRENDRPILRLTPAAAEDLSDQLNSSAGTARLGAKHG